MEQKKLAKDILIVGMGLAGITLAERFANKGNNVLIIEKRDHIGGNCYDFKNKDGILIHKYGPHIFHTNYKEVWDYLSQFTDWIPYEHKVLGFIDGKYVPIPFNLNTLYQLLPKKAKFFEKKLIKKYGFGKEVPILELKKTKDKDLRWLADFIYKKIYYGYTKKQWGKKPEKMDPSVTGRVPIIIGWDDRYFHDKYQGIPKEGYTKMFERMLKHKRIKILLNTDYKKVKNKFKFDILFYTGPIDEFFDYEYGKLKYRCLKIKFKTLKKENYQPSAVVNYPSLKYKFTRITEFKKFAGGKSKKTTIGIEYPTNEGIKAWPMLDKENQKNLEKYRKLAKNLNKFNIFFIGRLAEFKYYNMDEIVKKVLSQRVFIKND